MAAVEKLQVQIALDDKMSAALKAVQANLKKTGDTAKNASDKFKAANDSGTKMSNAFKEVGSKAGRAGVQVQQFVGQVQGGTNPMLALSQQAADLGIVMGAPLVGVVTALGASLAMTLVPNLFKSSDAAKELREEMEELTDSYDRATNAQKAFAMSTITQEINEQNDDIRRMAGTLAQIGYEIERDTRLIQLYGTTGSTAAIAANENLKTNKERYLEVAAAIDTAAQKVGILKDQQNEIQGLATAEETRKEAEESQKLIDSLKEQQATFGMLAEQKQRYKILNMPEEFRAEALAIHDNILAQQQEKRTFEETEKAKDEIRESSIEGFNKLAAQNKKLFQIQKAYNIAQAIMDTYTGANKALALYPPPISYAMAAGQIALGMANVATIKSQSFSGRAVGGRVEAGNPYMVGEQGREMFIPSTRGQIVKNSDVEKMGGGSVVNVNFTVNAVDTRGFDELLTSRRGQIVNMVNQAMNDRGRAGVV